MASGPNQHYIPKFVQRPFGVPPKRHQIWCFERDKEPERRAIKRTGTQNYFYSEPSTDGHPTLDDQISEAESKLALDLQSIRSAKIGDAIDSHAVAGIIAHLAPRTAHIRDSAKQGIVQILDRAVNVFTDPKNLQAIVGLDRRTPNNQFREYVLRDLISRPEVATLTLPPRVLERIAFYYAKENCPQFLHNALPAFRPMFDALASRVDELVRNGHNRALSGSILSNPRESFLRNLNWKVENAPRAGAILPDCVVIAIDKDNVTVPFMFCGQSEIQAVIMAIAPEKLVVGRNDGWEIPPQFNYNLGAAQASYNYFLSPCNNIEMARLRPMIGTCPTSVIEESIEDGFSNILPPPSLLTQQNGMGLSESSTFSVPPTSGNFQYEATFLDFGDQGEIQRINDALQRIVSELSRTLPLGRLEGITLANDYPRALKGVDRGFDNAPPLETVSPEVGVGVAQMITVMRSGEVKGRIVMSSAIGHALTSEDQTLVSLGTYVSVKELALVAMIEIVDRALPGVLLQPTDREFDGWLYAHADAALHGYVASRIAAGFGNQQELVESKRQLLVAATNRMKSMVIKERLEYRYHGDVDALLAVAFPAVRQVLTCAADLLGHCSSAEVPPVTAGDELEKTLVQAGLANWFVMYRHDLERFGSELGRWESFNEFLAFNVHVERLLWQLGMVPWESSEGIRIEIPIGTDAAALLLRERSERE